MPLCKGLRLAGKADLQAGLQDAMTFPLIGSAVLLGLFLLFKFLPPDLINLVLAGYFVLIGIVAITVTISPFLSALFPAELRKRNFKLPPFTIPYLAKVTFPAPFIVPLRISSEPLFVA